MKKWTQPLATVEKFVANEYVAACWAISCQVPYENESGFDPFADGNKNLLHRKDHCGAANGFTVFTDENNVPYKLVHNKAGGSSQTADLSGSIFEDAGFSVPKDIKSVQIGETIYIRTQNGNNKWHHHGVVRADSNHS